MARNLSRPLTTDLVIENFLDNCIGVQTLKSKDGSEILKSKLVRQLRDAEASVAAIQKESTAGSESCRHEDYRSDPARRSLRCKILDELCSLPRLDDDEQIKLGVGGARPQKDQPLQDKNAYLVTGLPASGKSTLVNTIAEYFKAMIVDSDYAKRKFPEFDSVAGAQIVHQESAMVVEGGCVDVYGEEEASLLGFCKSMGFNIVMPKIGHDYTSLTKLKDALIASGYKVHLTTVVLSRELATRRALQRYLDTDRYVPIARIFDTYANDPALTYYQLRVNELSLTSGWESFGALCSKVKEYKVLDYSSDQNPAALFRSTT